MFETVIMIVPHALVAMSLLPITSVSDVIARRSASALTAAASLNEMLRA